MEHYKLIAKKREVVGKKASKSLRKQDLIPSVMYGGEETIHFYLEGLPIEKALHTPKVYIFEIEIEGTVSLAIIKDTQFHPVSDKLIHVDFYQVSEGKPVSMYIPVRLIGLSIGVKNGGRLKQNFRYLRVQAFHEDLPDFLEVDITNLKIGQSIKVRDLSFDKLTLLDPMSSVLVAVLTARGSSAEELEEEEEAKAKAEAAEAEAESSEE
jgi:large subunit ribosomal protein L25